MEGLCRIVVDGNPFFLLTDPVNEGVDGFELTLCDGENVWKKSVTKEEVLSMADAVDMSVQEYARQTMNVLTGQLIVGANLVYQVTVQGETIQFSWKKSHDGVKFQLGSLMLDKVPDCSKLIMEMFGLAVKQINQFKEDIAHLQSENNRLSSERQNAIKFLDKFVTAKDNMENDLYFKFASVLNKKKEKIRQLKSQVEDLDRDMTDRGLHQGSPVSESGNVESRTPSPTHSDTSPDDKHEEKPSAVSPPFLAVEEDETISANAKRRRRRGPQKGTPKSKLVLPKVASLKKTPSTSSEDSLNSPRLLRKRTSQKSEPDPDDLMAEMAQ